MGKNERERGGGRCETSAKVRIKKGEKREKPIELRGK